MLQLVCKKIPLWRPAFSLHRFSTSSSEFLIPESNKSEEDKRLFIINYLKKTCGVSQKSAESFSKYLHFETRQKPDSVISFFKQQGFTGEQILLLIRKYPKILGSSNLDKKLLPKFEFFRSIGLSTQEIVVLMSRVCQVLGRSLEKQIIPVFRYLSTLLQSHDKALLCIKRRSLILVLDLENSKQNVGYLGEVGVPHENIVTFVRNYTRAISCKPDQFRTVVDGVRSMGMDPLKGSFITAVNAFGRNSECLWKKKVEIYKSYGFSDADISEAFRRCPLFMVNSTDKIQKVMDYLVKTIGFEPSVVVKRPNFVFYSLEKRIVPRCNVYQALLAKDLVPKKFSLKILLESPEKKFLCTFVEPFVEQVPGLLMMYKNSSPVSM